MKRIISIIMTLSALALVLASCGKEPMPGRRDAQAIKLTVSGVNGTKASVVTTSALETQGKFNITAYVTGEWEKDVIGHSGVNAPGLYTDPEGGALANVEVNYYPSGNTLNHTKWVISGNGDGSGIKTDKPAFSWINAVAMNFFAYAPATINGTRNLDWTNVASPYTALPFSYTTKATSGTVASSDCDDIIFAYASNTASYGSDQSKPSEFGELLSGSKDYIDLKFYHALSQIRFCVSTDDGTYDPSIKLKSITLKGVSSAGMVANGSCVFNGSASTFGWTLGTTTANYTQIFGGTDGVTFGTTAPTGWTLSSYTDSGSNTYNLYTCDSDVLFLIPQNPKDCVVDITLNVGGTDTTITGKLQAVDPNNSSKIWEAGKVYTYKVKAGKNGGLDLLPDGWFNGGGNINI